MVNISQDELTTHPLRPLGALENYAWQVDTTSPKHFSITAEVSGKTSVEEWANALKKVQARHPLANIRVDKHNGDRLHFFHDPHVTIPLRVARLNKVTSIERELEREFAAPFGFGDVALLKATLLYSEDRCVLIMTAHHSIADGRSLTYFIHDVLETLAGKNLPALPLLPSIEDICLQPNEPAGNINPPALLPSPMPYAERSLAQLKIQRLKLSKELSQAIRVRSKQEHTTVHGALSAAVAIALHSSPGWSGLPVRICTPIDARKYADLDYGLSFLALFPTYDYAAGNAAEFWNIARAVTDDLNAYRERPGMAALIHLVQEIMENNHLPDKVKFDREICAPDILISNLGVLPFAQEFGHVKLESLWGPSVLIGTEGEQTVGVATINGAIHLIHTSYKPAPDFLATAEKALAVAAGLNLI